MLDFLLPSSMYQPAVLYTDPYIYKQLPAPSRRPDLDLLLNPAHSLPYPIPSTFRPPPASTMQRPPMHPHQYSSSSITSTSSFSSTSTSSTDPTHHSHHHSQNTISPPISPNTSPNTISKASPINRRRFTCTTCNKDFSTSGHLARHMRVHTGERNHPCPFAGCTARCSRQDNLVQHFRVHMPREDRRASSVAVRAALARCLSTAPTHTHPSHPHSTSQSHHTSNISTSHTATPTRALHGELPSRSPSPTDDMNNVSLGSPDYSPSMPSHPIPGENASYFDYPGPPSTGPYSTSYTRGSPTSPGSTGSYNPNASLSGPGPLTLPLPPSSFPYASLPLTHPHPSYHSHPPLSSPHLPPHAHTVPNTPNVFGPPSLSPGGSGGPSSGSPLTPAGWGHPQQVTYQTMSSRVVAPSQQQEFPWYGWDGGEKRN